jgi:hypothetical protein
MKNRYLEITFRRGRAFTAYLYLPRPAEAKVSSTLVEEKGLKVDLDAAGALLGIEITAPAKVGLADLNLLLRRFGQPDLLAEEWAPAQAA